MTLHDQRRTILYFGNDWYAENRTSSHQIARRLAQDHDVYYLECPGLRAPQGSGRDLRKLFAKLWRFLRGSHRVSLPGSGSNEDRVTLRVRTLFQVPFHRFAVVRLLNQWILLLTIRWLILRERIRKPVAWHMVPHLANTVGHLGEDVVVYYCIDDYAALPGVGAESVRQMDERLTRLADTVFVASDTLYEQKKKLNARTFVSAHGVDLEHFGKVGTTQLPVPANVSGLTKPVIGFFGLIEQWIDLDLVAELAKRRPTWTFLMVGRIAVPAPPTNPNIRFVGHCPYDLLPAYGNVFDVSIIPYRKTVQVYHANPIKLREYLAMGKPIVSVRTPHIEQFADVVAIADSVDEFELLIQRAIEDRSFSDSDVAKRRARVQQMSWSSVVRRAWAKVFEGQSVTEPSPSLSIAPLSHQAVRSLPG